MHILFLTDNFPPEGNAPASRTYEHAVQWVRSGHKVTVITGAPNFPEGKIFPGFKNPWHSREDMSGIDVVRVKTFVTANEGFVLRILDYISFMVTSFFAGLFVKRPDVIVATSPQFFTAVSGWVLSAIKRKPYVFELRDIWPASITAVGAMKKSLVIRVLEKLEMFLYRRADRIISVTESFKRELGERGINKEKIAVVLNGVDLGQYQPVTTKDAELAKKYGLTDKFVVGYVGTHGMAHGLRTLVDSAELLTANKKIVFLFAGGGSAKSDLDDYVAERNLPNVVSIKRVPKELMPRLWSLCDVSLVHLMNAELFRTVIPSKIFESMGMGLPMIIGVPEGEATRIVRDSEAGIVVLPENSQGIANAVKQLYDDGAMYARCRENSLAAARSYSRESLATSMEKILLSCVRGKL